MAKVTHQHLGKLHGKLNQDIFRLTPKGGTTVYRIKTWTKPDTTDFEENNDRFSIGNTFACSVNDMVNLKRIWKSFRNIKGVNARNKIFNFNYAFCKNNYITNSANIVPNGLDCRIVGFSHNNDNIEIEILPPNSLLNVYKNPAVANCLIYSSLPEAKRKGSMALKDNGFTIVEQHFDELTLKADQPYIIKFLEDVGKYKHLKYYNLIRIYFSLVFSDIDGKLEWTFSKPFAFKGADIDEEYNKVSHDNALKSRELTKITPKTYYRIKQR